MSEAAFDPRLRAAISSCGKVCIYLTLIFCALPSLAVNRAAPWVGETLDGRQCHGDGIDSAERWDYNIDKGNLEIVERYHFTPEVEHLVRGNNNVSPIQDINYTLTKIPNHPRALYSAVRFALSDASKGLKRKYPAECYLQRAIVFSPNDAVPYALYGLYLHRLGEFEPSMKQYRTAESRTPNDPSLLYNIGLLLYDMGDYDQSYRYAKRAYALGFTLPGLKKKLQEAGRWH